MRWILATRARIHIRKRGGRSNRTSSRAFKNYVALPRSEAFRIEYWALEEAKLQRMPAEAEFSRKIVMVVGGGSGIGREVVLLLARKGAHIVVADMNEQAIKEVAAEAAKISSADAVSTTTVDISSAESVAAAAKAAVSGVRRDRRDCQHGSDFSGCWRRWPIDRGAVEQNVSGERNWKLPAGARVRLGVERTETAGVDCADEFGERGCFQARQRSLRCQQDGAESSDS